MLKKIKIVNKSLKNLMTFFFQYFLYDDFKLKINNYFSELDLLLMILSFNLNEIKWVLFNKFQLIKEKILKREYH